MRQPLKEFVSAVMVHDRLSDDRAERDMRVASQGARVHRAEEELPSRSVLSSNCTSKFDPTLSG